ncbi:MAG TPA: tetratricopeptide repeat protein [Vicinamibacterales bacterium]|nr:tetratricopeptide repeat protein [Vicinamibacterales bacterium]
MSSAVGVDPIDRVFMLENHDEACEHWRQSGVRDRLLVHIDAHHDAARPAAPGSITIADYVRAAVQAGLVREAIWVVPEPSWQRASVRRTIERHLARLDMPMRACPISALPAFSEPVLLDVDVDYFVIPEVRFGVPDVLLPRPWCRPGDLVDRLHEHHVRTDFATIAYSVEGGHTPLRWKYLGDELATILRTPSSGRPTAPPPGSAAQHYGLAHAHLEAGRLQEARASLQQAYSLDPSYRTPYGSGGLALLQRRDWKAARGAFQSALALDPLDASALAGLGRIAAQAKHWREAERYLSQSLALDAGQVDASRVLGDVFFSQRRWTEAELAYTRAIALALSGERSLDAPISSAPDAGPADPHHGHAHAQLARLAARRGDLRTAIAGLRISLAAGPARISTRLRLAWLQLRSLAGW